MDVNEARFGCRGNPGNFRHHRADLECHPIIWSLMMPVSRAENVVRALLTPGNMRGHRLRVLCVFVLIATAIAIVVLSSGRLEERIMWLANQPSGTSAFQHPESGRSDALIALISTAVLTPIAIFIVMIAFMFVVGMFEGVLVLFHLPDWMSAPMVGLVSIVAMYLTASSWVPPSFAALTLVARAYIVFSHTNPPLFR